MIEEETEGDSVENEIVADPIPVLEGGAATIITEILPMCNDLRFWVCFLILKRNKKISFILPLLDFASFFYRKLLKIIFVKIFYKFFTGHVIETLLYKHHF